MVVFHKQPELRKSICIIPVFQGTVQGFIYELFLFASRQSGDAVSVWVGPSVGGKEKNSQPPPGLEPQIIQPVVQRCTTELSRLLYII
jgi:hypothetical protein